jgi:hypothetical protein
MPFGMAEFDVESFTWDAGAFTVLGDWSPGAGGRPRLLVEVGGRTRNVGAQGGKTAGGRGWRATFVCAAEPDLGVGAILKLGDDEIPIGAATRLGEAPGPVPVRRPRPRADARPTPEGVPLWFGYVVGAIIAIAFLLMLIWVL